MVVLILTCYITLATFNKEYNMLLSKIEKKYFYKISCNISNNGKKRMKSFQEKEIYVTFEKKANV